MAKKIILADDSITIQKVVRITLADGDYELITVDNGNEAYERIKAEKPDLVLLDVVMPGKSGYQVCEELKKNPELSHIPVILLAGSFEGFDEMKGAEIGADGYIIKPFESQTLIGKVEEMLSRAGKPRKLTAEEMRPSPAQEKTRPMEPQRIVEESAQAAPPQLDQEVKDFMADLSSEMDQPAEKAPEQETAVAQAVETEAIAEPEMVAEPEPVAESATSEAEQLWGEAEVVPEEEAGGDVMEAEMVSEDKLWDVPPMEGEEVSAGEAVSEGEAVLEASPEEPVMEQAPMEAVVETEPAGREPVAEPVLEAEQASVGTEAVLEPEVSGEPVAEVIAEPEASSVSAEQVVQAEPAEQVMETVPLAEMLGEPEPEARVAEEPIMTGEEVAPEVDTRVIEGKVQEAAEEIAGAIQAGISHQELINLIRDTVERVAWEVVPEMAEALIKERISHWEAQTQ